MATKTHSITKPCGMALNHPTAPRDKLFDCILCQWTQSRSDGSKSAVVEGNKDHDLELDIHFRVKKLTPRQKAKLISMTRWSIDLPKDDIRRQENGSRHLEFKEQCLTRIEKEEKTR